MYDEPSSYLDVKQRLKVAAIIRDLAGEHDKYVICVEHDLAVLDFLSDYVCVLYGTPAAYGVVTMPYSVREGINIFLDGFVPTENLRFRTESLTFRISETADDELVAKKHARCTYPEFHKTLGDFHLKVEKGNFTDSEIIVMLGENGTGKTTFVKALAGFKGYEPDNEEDALPSLEISYKPQTISPKFKGTVRQLFHKKIPDMYTNPRFISEVMKPLQIDPIIDQAVLHLSGGELQRVAICMTLGTPANLYLIDEPSAYLDSEQRISCAKVIKRFIMGVKKTAFIVEHDFIMATYLADRVIVYDGVPAKDCVASRPHGLVEGMNDFLSRIGVTFRRDSDNFRPRINKLDSVLDREQKSSGNYFFLE